MSHSSSPVIKRILLKLSGEALQGEVGHGICPQIVQRMATEIAELVSLGVQVGLVIGGGNIVRGAGLEEAGISRVTGDHMGMLATLINALAMQDALEKQDVAARVMSAISVHDVCEDYVRRRAIRHLEKGRVTIFAAGTGNPYFTTDSAASLRGIEIGADLILKATKVDGVYSADPNKDPDAKFLSRVKYDDAIEQKLGVMDAAALVLCRDQGIPIRVFNMTQPGALLRIIEGEDEGTLVTVKGE